MKHRPCHSYSTVWSESNSSHRQHRSKCTWLCPSKTWLTNTGGSSLWDCSFLQWSRDISTPDLEILGNPLNQVSGMVKRGRTLPGITRNLTFFTSITYQTIVSKKWFYPETEIEERIYSYQLVKEATCIMGKSLTSSARLPGLAPWSTLYWLCNMGWIHYHLCVTFPFLVSSYRKWEYW